MATAKQKAANRRNAKKSTGPVSPEGKAQSSMNSLSHGLTSRILFTRREQPAEFWALLSDFMEEFHPETPFEQTLVERMALAQWNSLRSSSLETLILSRLEDDHPYQFVTFVPLLLRYHAAADREYHRAHKTFITHRKERRNGIIGFVSQNASEQASEQPANPAPKAPAAPPKPSKPAFVIPETPIPEDPGPPPMSAAEKIAAINAEAYALLEWSREERRKRAELSKKAA